MLSAISEVIAEGKQLLDKVFGYDEAGAVSNVRKYGQVMEEEYRNEWIYIKSLIPREYMYLFVEEKKKKEAWEE